MQWTIVKKNIKDLHECAINPRILTKDQAENLRKSIDTFGQCEPIVINTDNLIIGGHQRLRIMKKLKRKEVDCFVPDATLTDKEVRELSIRLNKNTGEWDWDMLSNAWDIEELVDWGFSYEEFGMADEEKPKPKEKFKITIEFDTKELLIEHYQECESLCSRASAKMKATCDR